MTPVSARALEALKATAIIAIAIAQQRKPADLPKDLDTLIISSPREGIALISVLICKLSLGLVASLQLFICHDPAAIGVEIADFFNYMG
jgi:hypothetical protein